MPSRKVLTENIAALSVLQMLNYAAPLLTVPYLVRVLGPSYFGMLSFAQGVVLYFDLATDYGFNYSATRAIAGCRENRAAVSGIFWSTLFAKFALMCVCGLVFGLLVAFVPKLRGIAELLEVSFLYVIGTVFFPIWLFQGLERLKLAAALFGIARLTTVPALFIFVRSSNDYLAAGAIQASVELLASILALPYLITRFGLVWRRPSLSDIAASLKQGWPLFLSGSAFFLSTSSTTVILGFLAGQAQVGYFSAADKLIKAAVAALNPASQALYPHLTGIRMQSREWALRLIGKSLIGMGTLSLLISIATFLLAKPICTIVLGPSFSESINVLKWLSPLPLLFGLVNVFGTQTMLVFAMDQLFTRIMLRCVLIALPLTFLLSMAFGAVGAAAASAVLALLLVVSFIAALRTQRLPVWENLIRRARPSSRYA